MYKFVTPQDEASERTKRERAGIRHAQELQGHIFEPKPRAHVVENGVRDGTFRSIWRVHSGTFGYIRVHSHLVTRAAGLRKPGDVAWGWGSILATTLPLYNIKGGTTAVRACPSSRFPLCLPASRCFKALPRILLTVSSLHCSSPRPSPLLVSSSMSSLHSCSPRPTSHHDHRHDH